MHSRQLDSSERHRSLWAQIPTAPFLVAVGMLAAAAALSGPVADWIGVKREKLPLPLRRPLGALEEDALAPYRVVERHVLEPIVVEALGAQDYLSWTLEDASVPRHDPLRFVHLLVTYDTGAHNLVPHTPDVCRLGAGYQPAQPHENVELRVDAPGLERERIPVRVCTFAKTDVFDHETVSVVYTFFCNGQFVATRSGVRILINDLSNTYAYFSKVEVSFPHATRAQCMEGASKLLGKVLPALIGRHYPDFEAAEALARERGSGRTHGG